MVSRTIFVAPTQVTKNVYQDNADVVGPRILQAFHFDLVVEEERGGGTQGLELEVGQHDQLHPQELFLVVASGTKTERTKKLF